MIRTADIPDAASSTRAPQATDLRDRSKLVDLDDAVFPIEDPHVAAELVAAWKELQESLAELQKATRHLGALRRREEFVLVKA